MLEASTALVSGWFSGELLNRSIAAEKDRLLAQMATFKALGAPVLVYAETTGTVQNKIDVGALARPRLGSTISASMAASSPRSPNGWRSSGVA